MFETKFGRIKTAMLCDDPKAWDALREDVAHYIRSYNQRLGPVPFAVLGSQFGRRARKLGISIGRFIEAESAFVVTYPTPKSRACVLRESVTPAEELIIILEEQGKVCAYSRLKNVAMDRKIDETTFRDALAELVRIGSVQQGEYYGAPNMVWIKDDPVDSVTV